MSAKTGKFKKNADLSVPLRTFVLDSEALSSLVSGDRHMMARLAIVVRGEADAVTSAMTTIEAHDGKMPDARWSWILSRLSIAPVGKDEAKEARGLLKDVGLHGHKYAIDAVLAVVARRLRGDVIVYTSDVDDMEKLLPSTVLVKKV